MKKKVSQAVIFTLLICVGIVMFACNKSVKLVDFADYTVTADLGSTYTFSATSVKDTEGKTYRLNYSVTDADGNAVDVIGGAFTVDDLRGYKATASVEIGGTVHSINITVNVRDVTPPNILIDTPLRGFATRPYTLPQITVTDNTGEQIVPTVKVVYIGDGIEVEQTVSDGVFTPETEGNYRIVVSATDSAGNSDTVSSDFFVRNALGENLIEDFYSERYAGVVTNKQNGMTDADPEWLETFEGRDGVVKTYSTGNAYGPHWYFSFDMTTDELAELRFESIYADVYVTSTDAGDTKFIARNQNVELGTFNTGEWVRVELTTDQINNPASAFYATENETARQFFNRKFTSDSGYYLFWIVDSDAAKYTLYVDRIGYVPSYDPILSSETTYNIGDEITLVSEVPDLTDYSVVYTVRDPEGKTVTLSGDKSDSFRATMVGTYVVEAVVEHSSVTGSSVFEINVTSDESIEVGAMPAATIGAEYVIPEGTLNGATVTAEVIYIDEAVEVKNNTFTPQWYGEYTVIYKAEKDGLTWKRSEVITIEPPARAAAGEYEIESFDHPDSVSSVGKNGNSSVFNVTWRGGTSLGGGETGVVQIDYESNAYPAFVFFPRQNMAAYANADFIVIRAYIPSDCDNSFTRLALTNKSNSPSLSTVYDEWHDYIFGADFFLSTWNDSATLPAAAQIWGDGSSKPDRGTGRIYISDIRVISAEPVNDVLSETTSIWANPADKVLTRALTTEEHAEGSYVSMKMETKGVRWPSIQFRLSNGSINVTDKVLSFDAKFSDTSNPVIYFKLMNSKSAVIGKQIDIRGFGEPDDDGWRHVEVDLSTATSLTGADLSDVFILHFGLEAKETDGDCLVYIDNLQFNSKT